MKRILDLVFWIFLYVVSSSISRRKIQRLFRPIDPRPADRRMRELRAHWVGGDRRQAQPQAAEPFPVLTKDLMLTTIGTMGVVIAFSLGVATAGYPMALMLIPIYVAYIYVVLFIQTIIDALRTRRQVNQ